MLLSKAEGLSLRNNTFDILHFYKYYNLDKKEQNPEEIILDSMAQFNKHQASFKNEAEGFCGNYAANKT